MASTQIINKGVASGTARNPMPSKEPISDPYSEKRFRQIIGAVRGMDSIREGDALLLLASIKRIKERSGDPAETMDNIHNILSAADCEEPPRSGFYIRYYSSLFGNPGFDESWVRMKEFSVLRSTVHSIESASSGDPMFDSLACLARLAGNPRLTVSVTDAAYIVAYRTSGYGTYLGIRVLDSIISNPNFRPEWLGSDTTIRIGDFAEDINRYRLCGMKFDCFDNICHILSDMMASFSAGIFANLLKQHDPDYARNH